MHHPPLGESAIEGAAIRPKMLEDFFINLRKIFKTGDFARFAASILRKILNPKILSIKS